MNIVLLVLVLVLLIVQRLTELRLARQNLEWAVSNGGREFGARHYPLFFLLHVSWFVGLIIESLLRSNQPAWWYLPLLLAIGAQAIRYRAISDLGRFWNTRIVVIPGMKPIRSGIYQYLRHPNYLAVVIELFCIPLAFGAPITAIVASILNALLLLLVRIPAEERALKAAAGKG